MALLPCRSASPFSVSFSLLRGEKATGLLRAHFPLTHAQLVGEVGILPLNTAAPPLLRGEYWGFGIPFILDVQIAARLVKGRFEEEFQKNGLKTCVTRRSYGARFEP